MRRFVRTVAIVLLLLATALLASSVGVVMPRSFRAVGPDGASAEAWVAYVYQGYRFGLVLSVPWGRPGGIALSDVSGGVRLPMLVYLKAPLDGWLHHEVRMIHAPTLHTTLHEHEPEEGAILTIPDNTGDPDAWDHALGEIYSLVAYDMTFDGRYAVEPETARTLARQVVDDYRALLATHGDRPREIPAEIAGHLQFASDQDRAEWQEQIRREIEREPTWGAHLERRYARRIAELEEMFGL
jgi:hypothetical protein